MTELSYILMRNKAIIIIHVSIIICIDKVIVLIIMNHKINVLLRSASQNSIPQDLLIINAISSINAGEAVLFIKITTVK